MNYYVAYQNKSIIEGPMDRKSATNMAEDLDFALEDAGYCAMSETRARQLHLIDGTEAKTV